MSNWQPIETAPRSGAPVWVRGYDYGDKKCPRHFCWAYWDGFSWIEANLNGSTLLYLDEWMPLPEPPK